MAGIRDDQRVGLELGLILLHVVPQAHAADFFFAFDQHLDVDGQLAGGLVQRIERADVNVHLSFVVGGAAAEEIAAAHGRLKRRRGPQVDRLDGLDVVMAVEKDGGLAGRAQRFGVDEGMHLGGHDLDAIEPGAAQAVGNPLGGALDVRLVLALGADAGDAQQFVQIVQVLVMFLVDVRVQVHRPTSARSSRHQQNEVILRSGGGLPQG